MTSPAGEAARAGWRRVAVWDAPVRIVHWAIAAGFAGLWWTGETARMDWHVRIGMALLGLVAFRLAWGVLGSSTARFSSFVRGPATVARYAAGLLRREGKGFVVGHNPMGGWSILAMLALLAAEIGLGLFAEDVDGLNSGPLAAKVSFDQGRWAAQTHHLVFNGLLVLVGLHLAAVAFYLFVRRENLLGAMVGGGRLAPEGSAALVPAPAWRLGLSVVIALAAMGIAWQPPF